MVWEENSRICLHMQLIAILSRIGVGIPKDRLSRLFSWFEQPDDMRDEAELDLSICQRLAQKIGGVLFIDELYARQGTRVVLVLPIK